MINLTLFLELCDIMYISHSYSICQMLFKKMLSPFPLYNHHHHHHHHQLWFGIGMLSEAWPLKKIEYCCTGFAFVQG